MNENLVKLLDTLTENQEILEKFLERDSVEDLYEYCTSIVPGYTLSKFEEFLNALVYEELQQQIDDGDLENIAGGTGTATKMASAMMGSLLLAGGAGLVPHGEAAGYNSRSYYNNNTYMSQKGNNNSNELKSKINSIKNNASKDQQNNYRRVVYKVQAVANENTNRNSNNNNDNQRISADLNTNRNQNNNNTNRASAPSNANNNQNRNNNNNNNKVSAPSNANNNQNLNNNNNNNNSRVSAQSNTNVNQNRNVNNNRSREVTIASSPKASAITYGQKLSASTLTGGHVIDSLGNTVNGSFSWVDSSPRPDAGIRSFRVKFTPTEDGLDSKIFSVNVDVQKATPNVSSWPSNFGITYGQRLSDVTFFGGSSNIEGKFELDTWFTSEKPDAGIRTYKMVFKPKDSAHYREVKRDIQINVQKATPVLDRTYFEKTYKENMTLNNFELPRGWSWDWPYTRLDQAGTFQFTATHYGDRNHNRATATVTIKIKKAEPKLSLPEITYSTYTRLNDIRLPRGWHWENPSETPSASKSTYKAYFNADEAGTNLYYSRGGVDVTMKVNKANPIVRAWAGPTHYITYGDNLNSVALHGGYADTDGSFKLVGSTYDMGAGQHMCKIVFTPSNPNFHEVSGQIPITILKNMTPQAVPAQLGNSNSIRKDTSISFKLSDLKDPVEFSIDGGWTWQDSSTFEGLHPGTPYNFCMRYKETNSRCTGLTSRAFTISTKESAPEAPSKPEVREWTNNKIVLKDSEEKNSENLEYSIDGGKTWQDSLEFKNLKKRTKYKIVSRVKETETHVAGKISKSTEVKTRSWLGNLAHSIFG